MFETMSDWLWSLEGVAQNPRHHPEGDALFHSLQVFGHAHKAHAQPHLLAAALLHDVGKATSRQHHADVGAQMLVDLPPKTRWLTAHHLDLLHEPRHTRATLFGTWALADLAQLRRWDKAGRDPRARVCTVSDAVWAVLEALQCGSDAEIGREYAW
jgi:hypothetical protein